MAYCEKCGKYSGRWNLCKECYYKEDEEELIEEDTKDLICPICGEPTRVYMGNARKDRLCGKHADALKAGELILDEKGHYVKAYTKQKATAQELPWEIEDTPEFKNKKDTNEKNEENNQIESIKIDQKIRCITCGYETEGKLFCKRCFKKYSEKEILIKVKNCKEIIPLDDFYEGYYECDDGHVVKSMAERDIDDYLFANNIKHGYEVALLLQDENGKRVTLHPDFCVFDEKNNPLYYIEYWGYDDNNRDYTKTKKYKMPLYENAGITLININAKNDLRNLKTNLQYKLNNFTKGISNFVDE